MKQNGYVKAVKAAFPYTIPVLTGYLFIGIAFGVMYQEKGYNFLWAILMSILVYAGSQFPADYILRIYGKYQACLLWTVFNRKIP